MKKRIFLFVAIMAMAVSAFGAKANSEPTVVTQKDGTQIVVQQFGDEYFSWYQMIDGTLLYHEGNDYYVARVEANGNLVSTGLLAHAKQLRSDAEKNAVEAQDKSLFFAECSEAMRSPMLREPVNVDNTYFPHVGTPKVLVVLADFADQKFCYDDDKTKQIFNMYLNSDGAPAIGDEMVDTNQRLSRNHGSVRQYFKDMSYGQFEPQFDVYGPVHLTENMAYYGSNTNGRDNMNLFIPDVCQAVDAEVDFSQYDSNNDGNADLVYIIYAGYGENMSGNSSNCIWPKSGSGAYGSFDGVNIVRYGVNNELLGNPAVTASYGYPLLNGIGLFCHEFSHTLGLPDFYPTTASAQVSNQAMENFSLMDGGEYSDNGYCPTAYTAYEREAMGWMDIETLDTACEISDVKAVEFGGKAYKIYNDQDPTGHEYYILENIQRGGWNNYLGRNGNYAHGLMITHVNYDEQAFSFSWNNVNNIKGMPRMTVLPANGYLMSSFETTGSSDTNSYKDYMADNLFPGMQEVTSFTYEIAGYPNPIVYTGTVEYMAANAPVLDISEDMEQETVSFVFIKKPESDRVNGIIADEKRESYVYNIAGMRVVSYTDAPHGIYIINGRKIVK